MQDELGSLFLSHVVSWSVIINSIQVECFVHRLS